MATSKITGLDGLAKALKKVASDVQAGSEKATNEGAAALEQQMRAGAPVASGNLRNRIETRPAADGVGQEVGPVDVDYAPFVEFGTSDMPAQPYVTPAAEAERQRFPGRVTTKVAQELR